MTKDALNQLFAPELQPGESLVWSGAPCRHPIKQIFFLSMFLVLTFGFLTAPLAYALATGDKSVFESMSYTVNGSRLDANTSNQTLSDTLIMLALIATAIVAGLVFWITARMKEIYAVTQSRAIIMKHFPFRRLASISLRNLVRIEKNGNRKIGTLSLFGTKPGVLEQILNFYGHQANSFMNIRNPYEVESILLAGFSAKEESIQNE